MIRLVKNQGAVDLSKKMMKGDPGGHYIPEVDIEGNLSWVASEEDMPAVEGANIRGVQGEPGKNTVWVGDEAPTDEYYNVWIAPGGESSGDVITRQDMEDYIDEALADASGIDLNNYYTKSEADAAIEAAAPDLSGYALKTEIPSTTGLATESYVDEKFNSIEVPEVDLENYYTKTEVDKKITDAATGGSVDLGNYYTKTETNDAIEQAVSAIEIPDVDLTGYATEQYVDEAIDAIEIPDNTPIATVEVAGKVKPDGTTITIAEDGTISSVGGSGGSAEVVVDGYTITKNADGALTLAYPIDMNKANGKGLAIGSGSIATNNTSFAAGSYTQATGYGSIALGGNAYATKSYAIAIGHVVGANSERQIVLGRRNISDSNGKYILIVGNGEDANAENGYKNIESNAMTIDGDGNVWAAGFYAGGTSQDDASELATKQYVDDVAAGSIDMSTYATRAYVDEALAAIVDGDEVSY